MRRRHVPAALFLTSKHASSMSPDFILSFDITRTASCPSRLGGYTQEYIRSISAIIATQATRRQQREDKRSVEAMPSISARSAPKARRAATSYSGQCQKCAKARDTLRPCHMPLRAKKYEAAAIPRPILLLARCRTGAAAFGARSKEIEGCAARLMPPRCTGQRRSAMPPDIIGAQIALSH